MKLLLPAGIYLLASLTFFGFGFQRVKIHWSSFQLLDRQDLAHSPTRSLLLLHSQPPVLNALLASCLRVSSKLDIPVRTGAACFFHGLGLASAVLIFMLVADLTRSRALASAATAAMLLDPGFHVFQHVFFYPFILHFMITATLFLACKAMHGGDFRYVAGAALASALIPNTRTLFHPAWALAFCLLLIVLVVNIHGYGAVLRGKAKLITAAAFLILLFAWPLKNTLLFDTFSFSTWSGINLSRGTPVRSSMLDSYLRLGAVSPEVESRIATFSDRFGDRQLHILAQPTKRSGRRNWHHYTFIETEAELVREAVRYRLDNPEWWLTKTLVNYSRWTRASFVQPYTGEIRGPQKDVYRAYAGLYRSLFFADVRPYLRPGSDTEPSAASGLHPPKRWTLFGTLGLPVLMAVTLVLIGRDIRSGISAQTGALILAVFILGWHLLVVCLTDGAEGNRMRFSVTPCLLVLGAVALARAGAHLRLAAARDDGVRRPDAPD